MPEISRSRESLLISGDDLQPSVVTELLRLDPTEAHVKWDAHPIRTDPDLKWNNSTWILESPSHEATALDDRIQAVLRSANPPAFASLRARGWTVEIRCGLFLAESNEGTVLRTDTLRDIPEAGATLGLDIYAASDD